MVLDFKTYRDKVLGCWTGKNIGGVFGAPFEGLRQFNDATFYVQDLSMGPPPNDDLDLQIVWLAAVERYGRNVNGAILGDPLHPFILRPRNTRYQFTHTAPECQSPPRI